MAVKKKLVSRREAEREKDYAIHVAPPSFRAGELQMCPVKFKYERS